MRKRWKKCVVCMLAGILILTGGTGVFSVLAREAGVSGSTEIIARADNAGIIRTNSGVNRAVSLAGGAENGADDGRNGMKSGARTNDTEPDITGADNGAGTGAADSGTRAGGGTNGTDSDTAGTDSGSAGTGSGAAGTDPGSAGTGSGAAGTDSDTAGTGSGANGTGSDTAGTGSGAAGTGSGPAGAGTGSGTSGDGTDSRANGTETGAAGADSASTADGTESDSDGTVRADIDKNPTVSADITIEDEDDDNVVIKENDKPYLALGADLKEEQKNTVLNLMGIYPADLEQYNVATVTNEEEHQYLDDYLDASTIGTRALSSVVIVKREKGAGIHISTKNITYCTVGMYKNALATAGLEDADVIVAGPFPLSGTAALIGAMKAYADMENEAVDAESLDAAMNEIVVTGELNDSLGDDVETEEFIAYVKQKVVEGSLQDKAKIQDVIADACKKFEISLSEEEKAQITALMEKIGSLDIDVDSLLKQAGSIYDSLKEMDGGSGFFGSIVAFFRRLLEAIVEFFKGLFG